MSQRQTLVLCCGLLCDARVWAAQKAAFEADFDVLPIDFLGLDSLVGMAEKVLASSPATFSIAGHSMGGRVALEVFRRAPQRVERLGLLDTGVHPGGEAEIAGRRKLIELGHQSGMKAVADAWLPPMVGPNRAHDRAMTEDLVDMICRATPEMFERQQHALITRPDAAPLLPTIRCPTLVATGRFDAWSPVADHEAIAKQIPGAQLAVFEQAGHMSIVETPDDVNAAFHSWLG